jgi:hypothetical protein
MAPIITATTPHAAAISGPGKQICANCSHNNRGCVSWTAAALEINSEAGFGRKLDVAYMHVTKSTTFSACNAI